MGRIIGVDYGRKRTGIAVTDPLQTIAGGLVTVATGETEKWLEEYSARETVERIVVGCPTMLDGSESDAMIRYVRPFVNRLKKRLPNMAIDLFDERYTSKMAVRAMIDGGVKKAGRRDKAAIDRLSAAILLQGYLERVKADGTVVKPETSI
jgi:putative Holliday junction resolvase